MLGEKTHKNLTLRGLEFGIHMAKKNSTVFMTVEFMHQTFMKLQ